MKDTVDDVLAFRASTFFPLFFFFSFYSETFFNGGRGRYRQGVEANRLTRFGNQERKHRPVEQTLCYTHKNYLQMTRIIHEFFIDEYLDTELRRCYARANRIEVVASVFVDFWSLSTLRTHRQRERRLSPIKKYVGEIITRRSVTEETKIKHRRIIRVLTNDDASVDDSHTVGETRCRWLQLVGKCTPFTTFDAGEIPSIEKRCRSTKRSVVVSR